MNEPPTVSRKRHCPPSFNSQSPWSSDDRLVEDYFARVNLALTRGAFDADTLLLRATAC